MPDKIIEIPNVGRIAFPDTMSADEINTAASKLYAEKNANHPPPDPKHSWVDTAVDWLPTVGGIAGGIIGGIGGTVAGMGVGGAPGAIGGATLGGASGEAARQLINDVRGKPTLSASEAAGKIGTQAALQGAGEVAGAGIAATMQPVARTLMTSALKGGFKTSLKAAKAAEAPPVVNFLLKEGVSVSPRGVEKLNTIIGASNQEIKNVLATVPFEVNPYRVTSRLSDVAKRAASQVNPNADVAAIGRVGNEFLENHGGRMLSGQEAQSLKTGTYASLGNKAYGELKSGDIEAQKALARGLKEEIETELGNTLQGFKGKLGLGVDIGAANAREGAALEARDAVARRTVTTGQRDIGGIGWVAAHPALFLASLMDRAPAVKSLVARGLYSSAGMAARVDPQLIKAAVTAIATTADDSTPATEGQGR
jgi:hypothetical protein